MSTLDEGKVRMATLALDCIDVAAFSDLDEDEIKKLWHAAHRVQCAIDRELLRRVGIGDPVPAKLVPLGAKPKLRVVK